MPDESIWNTCSRVVRSPRMVAGGLLLITALGRTVPAQTRPANQSPPATPTAHITRADVVRAEDARGKGPAGIQPILDGLRVPALRHISIRAIGRLERPDLVGQIVPFLSDPASTAVTANALVQSLKAMNAEMLSGSDKALVDSVYRLLRDRARVEPDAVAKGAIAQNIGRLPFSEGKQARDAESVLVGLAVDQGGPDATPVREGVAQGLYALARSRRSLGDPAPAIIDWLRGAAIVLPQKKNEVTVRRTAWLALNAAGGADKATIEAASTDADPQVRRLVIAAVPNVQEATFQRVLLDRATTDRDPMVRLEWVRVYRQLFATNDCKPLLAALSDSIHHVRLAAIDALGAPCPAEDGAVEALRRIVDGGPAGITRRASRDVSWHARAHALVSLAKVDAEDAPELLRRDARHPVWQVRMYVARGAAAVKDTALLSSLAFDSVGNVREAAIQGLSATLGHLADLVYVRALTSPDYHVVLAAARALRGAPVKDSVRPRVLDALDRLSRQQRQTSRDPRLELLSRIREMGRPQDAARLVPYLTDSDDAVAYETASLLTLFDSSSKQTGMPKVVNTTPAAVPSGTVRVRVTMSPATGGGTFDLLLDADRAPISVARVTQLIRGKYYDGLTFHRVVPNFVVQGGSPGMNEYVGDGPFMRDELSLAHHDRYTVGISTRGRDTGDAQFFINLVDNFRLDHDYTVLGRVVSGTDVVDRLLEGDVMATVKIVPAAKPQPTSR